MDAYRKKPEPIRKRKAGETLCLSCAEDFFSPDKVNIRICPACKAMQAHWASDMYGRPLPSSPAKSCGARNKAFIEDDAPEEYHVSGELKF